MLLRTGSLSSGCSGDAFDGLCLSLTLRWSAGPFVVKESRSSPKAGHSRYAHAHCTETIFCALGGMRREFQGSESSEGHIH